MAHELEKEWITKVGLKACCLFVNNSHRCGYVAIPKTHPLYGVRYSEECEALVPVLQAVKDGPVGKRGILSVVCADGKPSPELVFDVHGSITYSGRGGKYPIPGDDLWWYGFDCAHDGDKVRYSSSYESGGEERTLEYVEQECESLAEQLAQVSAVEAASGK